MFVPSTNSHEIRHTLCTCRARLDSHNAVRCAARLKLAFGFLLPQHVSRLGGSMLVRERPYLLLPRRMFDSLHAQESVRCSTCLTLVRTWTFAPALASRRRHPFPCNVLPPIFFRFSFLPCLHSHNSLCRGTRLKRVVAP